MYTYFNNCQNLEEAKTRYRELAMQHHPDKGGSLTTMQAINAEYARFQAEHAKSEANERQRKAHAEGRKSAADFHNIDEVTEVLRQKIEAALNLNLDVELCGLWIWVTGDTKPHKEDLKANAFKWAPEKKAWYYAGVPSFNRQKWSLDEIRETYGSQKFEQAPRTNIAGALQA